MIVVEQRRWMAEEVDLCVHPPHHHPLDPFAGGQLITRREHLSLEIVKADEFVLFGCDFIWDIVANYRAFEHWVSFRPPVKSLGIVSNFNCGPGFTLAYLPELPTNRPTLQGSRPMCQHWTMEINIGSRKLAYQIGKYRPSINAMEASLKV